MTNPFDTISEPAPECKQCGCALETMRSFCDEFCEREYYHTNRTCTGCGGEFWDGGTSCSCDDYDDENEITDCPKCGNTYDDADADFLICSLCGWDANENRYKPGNIDHTRDDLPF